MVPSPTLKHKDILWTASQEILREEEVFQRATEGNEEDCQFTKERSFYSPQHCPPSRTAQTHLSLAGYCSTEEKAETNECSGVKNLLSCFLTPFFVGIDVVGRLFRAANTTSSYELCFRG